MLIQLIFILLFLLSISFATKFGGKEGKFISAILSLAVAATVPATILTWHTGMLPWPILLVDSLCFFALGYLALKSRKYWPIWLAGLQLASIASHLSILIIPQNMTIVYDAVSRFWSIPMLLILVTGIYLDRRHQIQD